jgi:hypothetical protein
MTSQLEEELTRTLTGAADGAPPPGDDFLAGVRGHQRRRRNHRAAAVAACAIVITTVGTMTAVSLNTPAPPLPEQVATSWNGEIPDFEAARPAQEVWPDAVHRLPKTLPDGRQYQVVDVLGQDRYLITTARFRMAGPGTAVIEREEKITGPAVFDAKAKTVRPLYDEDGVIDQDMFFYSFQTVARVGDWAVWMVSATLTARGVRGGFELWSSRLDGVGGPRLIATLTERDRAVPHVGVAGEYVYWQQSGADGTGSAGVYRLPVSGGTPQLVPGSEGYSWLGVSPWVTSTEWVTPVDESTEPRQGELWNLVTGERRTWIANPGARHLRCDPVLCTGQTSDGTQTVQRLDGTGYQVLSPFKPAVPGSGTAGEGRFAVGGAIKPDDRRQYVWDRFTGEAAVTRMALTEQRPTDVGDMSFTGYENTTVQWPDGENGYYVLDLKAIG